jgi:NADP-dependent 3-hydroxy acid dehydrogenase YdfG
LTGSSEVREAEVREALVTGASSGIGRAVAVALAADGWRLHLTGRDADRLEESAAALPSAVAFAGDLTDDAFAARLAESLPARLHGLVHSAGSVTLGRFDEADVADLDRQFRINVRAPYLLTRLLLAKLRLGRGTVVFVNSGAGNNARAGWGQYAASKHALRALADALREEEPGLRVSSVYPGRTASPMQEAVHRMEGREYRPESFVQPEDVAEEIALLLRLPGRATVTDLSIRPGQ